jgi:hypothetical protein
MHVNAKIISVETVAGIIIEGMKESSEEGEFKHDIFDALYDPLLCHNVSLPRK